MGLETIEKRFVSFLERSWTLRDIKPFLHAYIRLLFLFKDEISQQVLGVLEERQKQLRGEEFSDQALDELRNSSRNEIDRHLRDNKATTREAQLNRMLFCALLDTEETDFFYLTEPLFEFAKKMEVAPIQLKQILESEFAGLKIES
jgi:hypothetical protein